MDTIVFFSALGCSIMLGFLYSVLAIRGKDAFYLNKFEQLFLKVHGPSLKILISMLSVCLILFCGTELQFSFFGIIRFFAALLGVFALTSICHILISYPDVLQEPIFLKIIPYDKSRAPIIDNLAILVMFVILAVGGCVKFAPPSLAILGVAIVSAVGLSWLISGIIRLIKGICKVFVSIYKGAVWVVRKYWQWVQSKQ